MRISENLKKELVYIILGFQEIDKVYVFEDKGLIKFYFISKEENTYNNIMEFVSKTTDIELEHEDVELHFIPYEAKKELEVLEEIKALNVHYEVYQ